MKRIKQNALEAVKENRQLQSKVAQLEQQLAEFNDAFNKNAKVQELKGALG